MKQNKEPVPFAGLKRWINHVQLKSYIFFHRSGNQPFALYDDQAPRKKPRGLTPRIRSFAVTMTLLAVLALIYPLRPAYSAQDYFTGLNTWFADTFPLRDVFLSINNRLEKLYGLHAQTITGEIVQGDEIPEVDGPDDDELEDGFDITPPVQPVAPAVPAEPADPADSTDPADPLDPSDSAKPADAPQEETPEEPAEDPLAFPTVDLDDEPDDLAVPELDEDAVVEQFSAVLSVDNAAYEYYNFVRDYADDYTSAINRAAENLDGIARVYSIIVPNSMGICVPEDIQNQVNTSDQKAAIKYMNSCFSEKVRAIPVYNTLLKHYLEGEYLYFRTDHHWTALGAYRAYERFAKAAGLDATPLDQFIPHEYSGFLGTFYNSTKSEAMERTPDTIYAYEPPSTNHIHITNDQMSDWLFVIIGNVDRAAAGNKYGTFIGGDNAFSYIENPNLDDGSSVMLIKESYGNAFAPFLVENYQYVYIVDYRYISQVDSRKLAQMCEDLDVRDVLFLNTISTTRSKNLIDKLDSFIG